MPDRRKAARGPIPACAGIGLRAQHHQELIDSRPAIAWLEAHSENYFAAAGTQFDALLSLREDYRLSLHGVGLSLGSTDPLDDLHLAKLKSLVERSEPALVSEHLSWGSFEKRFVNDLLPLPLTQESLAHLIERVDQTQTTLGRRILVENISTYLQFSHSEIEESEFLTELARATGCGLLIDINNIYVNARNHGIDARRFIASIAPGHVDEMHLAGHSINRHGDIDILIDTHSAPVCEEVWELYEFALEHFGPKPTLIEWDSEIPALETLIDEAGKAQSRMERIHDLTA